MKRLLRHLGQFALITVIVTQLLSVSGVISSQFSDLAFGLSLSLMVIVFLSKAGVSLYYSLFLGLFFIGIIVSIWMTFSEVQFTPYLAVALINAAVAYAFLRGQLPGRTPIILQLVNLIDIAPAEPATFLLFINRVCWIWVGLCISTSILGIIGIMAPIFNVTTDPFILGMVLTQISWFILSHSYANWRHQRPETLLDTIRVMARRNILNELSI